MKVTKIPFGRKQYSNLSVCKKKKQDYLCFGNRFDCDENIRYWLNNFVILIY